MMNISRKETQFKQSGKHLHRYGKFIQYAIFQILSESANEKHRGLVFFVNKVHISRCNDNWLSYRREIALQGGLVMAKSGILELRDNIYRQVYIQQP